MTKAVKGSQVAAARLEKLILEQLKQPVPAEIEELALLPIRLIPATNEVSGDRLPDESAR